MIMTLAKTASSFTRFDVLKRADVLYDALHNSTFYLLSYLLSMRRLSLAENDLQRSFKVIENYNRHMIYDI